MQQGIANVTAALMEQRAAFTLVMGESWCGDFKQIYEPAAKAVDEARETFQKFETIVGQMG